MRLHVGERLTGSGLPGHAGGYLVTSVVSESPWYGLYMARKLFHQYDFTARRPRETDEKEGLEVVLHTINYPELGDLAYVQTRRALLRAEARLLMDARATNAWPTSIDLLEIANSRDAFTFPTTPDTTEPEPVFVQERFEGLPLSRWRLAKPAAPDVLDVLGQLLQLIGAAHANGFVLQGVGPGAVLVDAQGQIHYTGTDMVVELARAASRSLAGLAPVPVPAWGRVFTPERFSRGFAAPEHFESAARADRRADLFAWAALAYLLLSGESPTQLALAQGRPWAEFREEQAARLDKALRAIAPADVGRWAEVQGFEPESFVRAWPGNFLLVWQRCLRPDPRQRPNSVADLRAWLVVPPPAPVPAAVALLLSGPLAAQANPPAKTRTGTAFVRLFLAGEAQQDVEVVIRRGTGSVPNSFEDGDLVADGAWTAALDDPLPPAPAGASPAYGLFARRRHASGFSSSEVTAADLLPADPAGLLRYAEGNAQPGPGDEPEPHRVEALARAFPAAVLGKVLLDSALPQVRGWALRRLARAGADPAARGILFQALQDPVPALRLEAARGLFGGAARPRATLVRKVAEALGKGNSDDCIQAARSLHAIGVDEEVIRETVAALQGDRPVTCPECGKSLPARDRPGHLVSEHGYLDVAGALLPRAEALTRLWDRVFTAADPDAHERLAQVFLKQSSGGPGYLAALEKELLARGESLFVARRLELPKLVHCLRASVAARPYFQQLLQATDPWVREVGRELILPELSEQLAGESTTGSEVRRLLDSLCPREGVAEKIRLCRRLTGLGLPGSAVAECLEDLQQELPLACPECGAGVPRVQLDAHLRQVHRIFQFRGKRYALKEVLRVLLTALTGTGPNAEAWRILEAMAQEQYGSGAASFLAASLSQAVRRIDDARRSQAMDAAAEAAATSDGAVSLAAALAADNEFVSRQLALRLVARLPLPVEEPALASLRPLLLDRRLPTEAQLAAAASLLRTTGKEGAGATAILEALVAGLNKARSIETLRQFEQQIGSSAALDQLCTRFEEQVRMRCPRCPLELRRPDMVRHLWTEHGLLLDGRRVREPWRLIEDWIEDYQEDGNVEHLVRGRALGERLDPEQGPQRVNRLLLAHGVQDAEARRSLLIEAEQQRGSLCPHCYSLVPIPQEPPVPALNTWHGRLSARGYRVEVGSAGLLSRLEIETPRGLVHHGLEPGRMLTQRGAILLLAGPPVLAAFTLAVLLPFLGVAPIKPVLFLLSIALVIYLVAVLAWWNRQRPLDRAFEYVWSLLMPRLHGNGFTADDSAFAAGLALASLRRDPAEVPRAVLEDLLERTEKGVQGGAAAASHLAGLWRLAITRSPVTERDRVALVVGQVARCFDGQLPLNYAQGLLADWDADWWTKGNMSRLRVMLADRAFEAGFEVRNLVEAVDAAPALEKILQTDDLGSLAQLRLLWSLRPRQPWERCGPAVTIFDLAENPESAKVLAKYPDLLLLQDYPALALIGEDGQKAGNAQVVLTSRGVYFGGVLFTTPPRTVEVLTQRVSTEGIYELIVEEQHFRLWSDPETLAQRLERWVRFYFNEFLPQCHDVPRWRSPSVAATLRAQQAVTCPECKRKVVTRLGEVGTRIDEAGDVTAAPV